MNANFCNCKALKFLHDETNSYLWYVSQIALIPRNKQDTIRNYRKLGNSNIHYQSKY
nr:MAG TPA: hypothetical protein [Bacteriophage sp.]